LNLKPNHQIPLYGLTLTEQFRQSHGLQGNIRWLFVTTFVLVMEPIILKAWK